MSSSTNGFGISSKQPTSASADNRRLRSKKLSKDQKSFPAPNIDTCSANSGSKKLSASNIDIFQKGGKEGRME